MVNRSLAYVGKMIQYFDRHGFEASFREGQTPDDDFVYLANASWIVAGGGGFSILAQQIAEARGATVWRPRQKGELVDGFKLTSSLDDCFPAHHAEYLLRGIEADQGGMKTDGRIENNPPGHLMQGKQRISLLDHPLPSRKV